MNIERQLSLIPLSQLNVALKAAGLPQKADKTAAVAALNELVESGRYTLDDVRAAKFNPYAVADDARRAERATATVTSGAIIPNDLRDQIVNATALAAAIRAEASALAQRVEQKIVILDATLQTAQEDANRASIDSGKRHLEAEAAASLFERRLNAQVAALQGVDPNLVQSTIRTEVSALFDAFRAVSTPEQLAAVAAVIPSTRKLTAKDVFGDVCRYAAGGEFVDFSTLEVEVWNDPDAPARVDDYAFTGQHLHQALIALDDPLPDNVWLAGERGTGKTEFVAQIASRLGRRLFRVNFDEALERAEFIGGNTIEAGSVVWKAGVITQAIQHPGAIILLDEIGFARAQNLAVLHALCERSPHRSIVIAETGVRIPVASHVVFFGADNSNGFGDASGNFAGVRDQNTAFLDRFSFTLRFDYLPHDAECDLIRNRTGLALEAVEVLVRFANTARAKARAGLLTQPPSLRQLFAWARAIRKGVPVALAFETAILNKFPADCESELRGVFEATIDVNNLKSFLSRGQA